MAREVFARWSPWNGGRIAATAEPSGESGRRTVVSDCGPEAGAPPLGTAQEPRIIPSSTWHSGSESSFKRVLERSGLTQKRKVRAASQSGRLRSGRKAEEPNQVWTVDFKGWWYSGLERCEPLTVRDEYSRYLLELRALEDARSLTVQKRFERLFECYGLPEAIRSDNGSPFASRSAVHGLSRLSAWWIALGIDLERGRPGHPQDNGAHERLHRDISLEL